MASAVHEGFLHILKNFAETRSGPVILLSNMNHNFKMPMNNTPKNFLRPTIHLNNIAVGELESGVDYEKWTAFTKYDLRINHLSVPNLNILARLVAQSINNLVIDNFNYDLFLKNIFKPATTMAEYQHYIDLGYLYPDRRVVWNLG
jgi:hypothetical protein